MTQPAVFVRRCLECHAVLLGLTCPAGHDRARPSTAGEGEWEVFDVTHARLICRVVVGGGKLCGTIVILATEVTPRRAVDHGVLHGRGSGGFIEGLGVGVRGLRRRRTPGAWLYEKAGFCPDCGEFKKWVEQHRAFCRARAAEVRP